MCLLNPIPVYRDGEDIKVYKVLKVGSIGEKYLSPYNEYMPCSTWKLSKTNRLDDDYQPEMTQMFNGDVRIDGGAFHTFANLKDAAVELSYWISRTRPERWSMYNDVEYYDHYVIAECIIPADTKYVYFGWFYMANDNPVPAYASQSLTPVRVLTKEEIKKVCA